MSAAPLLMSRSIAYLLVRTAPDARPPRAGGDQGVVEVPRTQPLQVQWHITVAGRPHRPYHLLASAQGRLQVVHGQLDPGQVAVVPDPQRAEAQGLEALLRPGHGAQRADLDGRPVGDTRGEAGGCRLVPGTQAQSP